MVSETYIGQGPVEKTQVVFGVNECMRTATKSAETSWYCMPLVPWLLRAS